MNTPIVNQGAFTAVVEVKKGEAKELQQLLNPIGTSADLPECAIDFSQLKTIHFLRLVILDETKSIDGNPRYDLPAYLVLSTNYDEPFENHLDDLISVGGAKLREIYSHCVDFDPRTTNMKSFLCNRQVPYSAFYVGTRGRTVQEIKKESQLRDAIQDFLDQRGVHANESPLEIRKAIQDFVANDTRFQWTRHAQRSAFQWRLFFYGMRVVFIVMGLLLLVGLGVLGVWLWGPWGALLPIACALALGALVLLWLWIVTLHESRELTAGPPKVPIMGASVADQKQREDQIVQNQLSNIVWIKPGLFRLATIRLVLALVNFLGRYYYVRGALGGIPTIHFARWVILNDNRRVLFFSNFDGSWENYLGDFIDKAASGLTAIWSNCIGCPASQRLTQAGASDEPAFKAWVRQNQLVTQVWYSSYDDLTVENINNNSYIRLGLSGDMSLAQTEEWLTRI